ncbi:MAG: 2-iminoacetate synthase ThiH [Spirochaetes bacterium]|nr:2-iminoacetate synthase ThiH [Spirochaetota bacterium]
MKTFLDSVKNYSWGAVSERILSSTEDDVLRALRNGAADAEGIRALLSPAAGKYLDIMSALSAKITRARFGNTVQLYAPLYISNECSNRCLYCGFNADNDIKRVTLNEEQIREEARALHEKGFRHVLLLTGEDTRAVPAGSLRDAVEAMHSVFASVSIEVYPMDAEGYRSMTESGADGLTLYQETYNRGTYSAMHPSGKKSDYEWRLDAPDRGGMAGFRRIGIGALLGLSDWRTDSFFTALHALYLSKKYWKTQVLVSFPRIRNAPGGFSPPAEVADRDLAQLICAMRIILPDAGLVLSTREPARLRDRLVPLGITSMSAGSKTSPGGYSDTGLADGQFSVEDTRSPEEITAMLKKSGLDPVWKDWDRGFLH